MPNILIIEDNKKLASFAKQFLQNKGLSSDMAFDGVSGLSAFAQNSYDLLLIDLKLPLMDGQTLCKKVRESGKGRDIPIIIMSGFVTDASEIKKIKDELKISSFFTKPFSFESLHSAITKILPEGAIKPEIAPSATATASPGTKPSPPVKKSEPAGVKVLKGKLEKLPFDSILTTIFEKKMTGILLVGHEVKKKKFYVIGGTPVEVEVAPEEENFGNYLIHKGLISMVELRGYDDMRAKAGGDPRDIFIKMGCLTPDEFPRESRKFLFDNLVECFSWKKGLFMFDLKPSFIKTAHNATVDMPLIFYHGFKNHFSPEKMSNFLEEKGGHYINRTEAFYHFQKHFSKEAVTDDIFSMIDGAKTGSDMLNSIDVDNESALAILYTLSHLKMISFSEKPDKTEITPSFPLREPKRMATKEEEKETVTLEEDFEDLGEELNLLADELDGLEAIQGPAAGEAGGEKANELDNELKKEWERIKDCNYYEVFGMNQGSCSFNDLKKKYFELTKKFGPDKFFASSGDILDLSQEFLSKVTTAYDTLSNVVSKENYDELLSSSTAEIKGGSAEEKAFQVQIQFQSGKVFLEEGNHDGAEKSFINCINLYPDKPEYHAYLALAIYNNPMTRGNATIVKRVKDLINKSLKLGKLSITYALKGSILLDEGNLTLAEAEFNKALKINPNNKTATKGIGTIQEMREQEKKQKGILGRMFR